MMFEYLAQLNGRSDKGEIDACVTSRGGMGQLPVTFDDWVENFNEWQERIGFKREWIGDFDLSIKFDWERAGDFIEFGDYKGRPKWDRSLQIPHQNIRDGLLSMITVQGDTEFASVEQQITTNKSMEDLLKVQNASLASAVVGFIGTDVKATSSELPLQDGSAEFTYTLTNNSKSTDITILDNKGAVVLNGLGKLQSGSHVFTWDGKDNLGNQLPDGAYQINVTSTGFDDQIMEPTTAIKAKITGVNMESGTTLLEAGTITIPLDQILAIKESSATSTQ